MIRIIHYSNGGSAEKNISIDDLPSKLNLPDTLTWVSLEAAEDGELLSVLQDVFHFHPLTIEDSQSIGYQTPKIDDFEDYVFIIAHALSVQSDYSKLDTEELDIFLGKNYIVTSTRSIEIRPVTELFSRLDRDERLHLHGADFLCHALLDGLVDDYLPRLDELEEEIDGLESIVIARPDPKTLARILELKHFTISLRKVISPLREVMNRLSRDDFAVIDEQSQIYFRDIYDHLVRINDLVEMIRDMASSALDVYLNSTSLRLNEVMKALTVVSTIFLPLTFLAGVYGMNFKFMPELNWVFGYPMVWIIFILIVLGMLSYFRRKKWF